MVEEHTDNCNAVNINKAETWETRHGKGLLRHQKEHKTAHASQIWLAIVDTVI